MMKFASRKGLAAVFAAAVLLTGCDVPPPSQQQATQTQTRRVEQTQQAAPAYYVQVDLRQSHFTLDPFEHMKDRWNAVQFPLPASKAQYEKLKQGDNLVDKFRSASFWIEGSIGSTKMTVDKLPAIAADADASAYNVKLRLYQSNFTIDIGKHIKNSANAVEFNWQVPGNVYTEMKVGDDLVKDGFRAGSFWMKGSVGSWHLQVLEKNGPASAPQPPAPKR
ncbi:MAG: hypothetical protein ACAH80_09180 [Alphaproteobacteria bacterium]